ncbi:glucose-1-phosphate cytidylyltransferase [bacterium]|nr:glucose-1-phosphate cytidylyltransferase [bacterium]
MKTIILAGGFGTRLSEETVLRPKPMVEIGAKPILWHVMNIYAAAGFKEFIIALGYKGEYIKEYFLHFYELNNDLTINLAAGEKVIRSIKQPDWLIHLVDTGLKTQTGGRVRRLKEWIGDETFMLTYGDGLADVPVDKIVEFHKSHGKLATVTAVRPPARFGGMRFDDDRVAEFLEKPQTGEGWINGGFFVLEPEVIDYITEGDPSIWERGPLERLAEDGQLMAYKHQGFFQPMDTLREKELLERLWQSGEAPWKMWS